MGQNPSETNDISKRVKQTLKTSIESINHNKEKTSTYTNMYEGSELEEGEIIEGPSTMNSNCTENVDLVKTDGLNKVEFREDGAKNINYYDRDFKPRRVDQRENEIDTARRSIIVYDKEVYETIDSWEPRDVQDSNGKYNGEKNDEKDNRDIDNNKDVNLEKNKEWNDQCGKNDHSNYQSDQANDHREKKTNDTINQKSDPSVKNSLCEKDETLINGEIVVDITVSKDTQNQRNITLHNRRSETHNGSREITRTSREKEKIKDDDDIPRRKAGYKRRRRSHSKYSGRDKKKYKRYQHIPQQLRQGKEKGLTYSLKRKSDNKTFEKKSRRPRVHSLERKRSSPILVENGRRVDTHDHKDRTEERQQSNSRYGSPVSDRSLSPYEKLPISKQSDEDISDVKTVCTYLTGEEQKKNIIVTIYKKLIRFLSERHLTFMDSLAIQNWLMNDPKFSYTFKPDGLLKQLITKHNSLFARDLDQRVWPKTDIKICNIFTANPYKTHECDDLHICKYYMLSKCDLPRCKFGHQLFNYHNKNVLSKYFLNDFDKQQISTLMRTKESRNITTLPLVCKFYNNEGGCTKPHCMHLHLCKYFLSGTCKFDGVCKRLHTLRDDQPARILTCFYSINPYEDDGTIIKLISKTFQDNKIKLKRDLVENTSPRSVNSVAKTDTPTIMKDEVHEKLRDDNRGIAHSSNTSLNMQSTTWPDFIPLDCSNDRDAMSEIKPESIKLEKDNIGDNAYNAREPPIIVLNSGFVKQELEHAKSNYCHVNQSALNDVDKDELLDHDPRKVVVKEQNESLDNIGREERDVYLNTDKGKEIIHTNPVMNHATTVQMPVNIAENPNADNDFSIATVDGMPTKVVNLPSWKSLRQTLKTESCIDWPDNRNESVETNDSLIPNNVQDETNKDQDLKDDDPIQITGQNNSVGHKASEADLDRDQKTDAVDNNQPNLEQSESNAGSNNVNNFDTEYQDEIKDEIIVHDDANTNCTSPTNNDCNVENYSETQEEMTRNIEDCDVPSQDVDSMNDLGEKSISLDHLDGPFQMENENEKSGKDSTDDYVTSDDLEQEHVVLVMEYKSKTYPGKISFRKVYGVWSMACLSDEWNELEPDEVKAIERFIDIMRKGGEK
ncbi:Zinc finger CCCH-type antiviral [Mactra antiquata]